MMRNPDTERHVSNTVPGSSGVMAADRHISRAVLGSPCRGRDEGPHPHRTRQLSGKKPRGRHVWLCLVLLVLCMCMCPCANATARDGAIVSAGQPQEGSLLGRLSAIIARSLRITSTSVEAALGANSIGTSVQQVDWMKLAQQQQEEVGQQGGGGGSSDAQGQQNAIGSGGTRQLPRVAASVQPAAAAQAKTTGGKVPAPPKNPNAKSPGSKTSGAKVPPKRPPPAVKTPPAPAKKAGGKKPNWKTRSGKPKKSGKSPPLPVPDQDNWEKAYQRVSLFMTILKIKGRYNSFLKYFIETGLNSTVTQLLPFYSTMLMVPSDAAFSKISKADMAAINSRSNGWLQLLAFHAWYPAQSGKELFDAPVGTRYSTADFPQRNIAAWKLKTNETMFNGRNYDTEGARLEYDSIYYDKGKTMLIGHGLDMVMIPERFY